MKREKKLTSESDGAKPQFYAKDILELAFAIGSYKTTSNRASNVHPGRQARRIAFRFDKAVGGLDFAIREIARLSRRTASTERDQRIQLYRRRIHTTMYKTQLHPQRQGMLDWSYWHTNRIVHYNTVASKYIMI